MPASFLSSGKEWGRGKNEAGNILGCWVEFDDQTNQVFLYVERETTK